MLVLCNIKSRLWLIHNRLFLYPLKKTFTLSNSSSQLFQSNLILEFSSKNANLTQSIIRNEIGKEVTLKKGVYTCGKDFEIGIYDIVLVEDGGSIEIETDGVGNYANSYIFGPDYKDIKEIRNYDFEIEEKIHIYGKDLVIKLSPSKNNCLFDK